MNNKPYYCIVHIGDEIRHIIQTSYWAGLEDFKTWYYSEYIPNKLDEFTLVERKHDLKSVVEKIQSEGKFYSIDEQMKGFEHEEK